MKLPAWQYMLTVSASGLIFGALELVIPDKHGFIVGLLAGIFYGLVVIPYALRRWV